MKGNYLITTYEWFTASDGRLYKAVWGNVEIVDDSVLGVKTNRNSTNWYAKVGGKENHMIVAGCQIYYAIKCEKKPNTGKALDWTSDAEHGIKEYEKPSPIYVIE
jgi:hypothetical protein